MWDNRLSKRNPKAPDYKCRDRSCDGVIWPPNSKGGRLAADARPAVAPATPEPPALDSGPLGEPPDDGLPF